MNAPFYQADAFSYPTAMALATALGFGFGFVLERAGFGRSTVLAAQFYGRDNRVLKVMFSAIATTTVGIALLASIGVLDLALLKIPETWLMPQLVGGALLGAGFVMAGYCPGTAVVAIGSGYVDGLLSLLGVGVGSLIFGFAYPQLQPFYESTARGVFTLPALLGVSMPLLAVAVAAMAIGAFLLAEKLESVLAKRDHAALPAGDPKLRNRVFVGLGAAAALAGALPFVAPKPATASAVAAAATPMAVTELARHLAAGTPEYYVVDLRSPAECAAARIAGAMCLPEDDPDANFVATLPATRAMVVYGKEGSTELPAGLSRFKGSLRRVEGGFAAWERQILRPPTAPATATAIAVSAYRERAALHEHFTGAAAPRAPAVVVKPTSVTRAVKKGGGC
ncbi:MAG: YeeE/YedE thiosulfate transporter family protein [Polyangiaceae bacterium]